METGIIYLNVDNIVLRIIVTSIAYYAPKKCQYSGNDFVVIYLNNGEKIEVYESIEKIDDQILTALRG